MKWTFELYRAFFVALGSMEVLSNLFFLLKDDGIRLARKQHQEVPPDISIKQMRLKVLMMFSFGIVFLVIGLYSYISRSFPLSVYLMSLGIFSIYAISEAFYYKYWKTIGFAIISIIFFLLLILLH